jgi:hypothetical protein
LRHNPALQEAFDANRRAIASALSYDHICAHKSVAGPDGCAVCGNTVEVRGYDCWACESAFDAPVRDTSALAAMLAHALEMRAIAERGPHGGELAA